MAILPVQLLFHPTISLLNGLGHCHVARPNSVPTFSFFIDSNKYLCKISRLTSPVMFSSIRTRFPTLDDEKESQHYISSSVFDGENCVSGIECFLRCSPKHNPSVRSKQIKFTFISSWHLIPEALLGCSRYFWIRFIRLVLSTYGLILARRSYDVPFAQK